MAFLFTEADSKEIINQLQWDLEYIDVKYVPGALLWHVSRKNQNKSKLAKIIGTKLYQPMTVRNVNTARKLLERI